MRLPRRVTTMSTPRCRSTASAPLCPATSSDTEPRTATCARRRERGSLGQDHQTALVIVGVDEALARRAGELIVERALRGYDAVHLASAFALGPGETILVTWDRDFSDAAVGAGVAVAPPPVITGSSDCDRAEGP
jgi:PIN domain